MSKRHGPSFFFSVIVHLFAILIFYSTYKYVTIVTQKKVEEKRVHMSLCCCVPEHKLPLKQEQKPLLTQSIEPKKIVPKEPIKAPIKKPPPNKILQKVVQSSIVTPIQEIQKEEKRAAEEKLEVEETSKEEILPEEVQAQEITQENKEVDSSKENFITTEVKSVELAKEKYINTNIQKISQLLCDNLYYPRRARKRGIVGEVVVKFQLSKDAVVSNIEVVSSESEILSNAAIKTIEDLSGNFPKPDEELILQIPINYSLTQK